ncbi:collagen triple helix repeat protein, partial [Bacteriovorax sp. BSW11_IV]|uniref:collagen-like triple helix repeat-containing protein n=1 Tax=Bacteriovorax sp. BSW11_IV TaxID=1353529 RepID=UPI00038A34EE
NGENGNNGNHGNNGENGNNGNHGNNGENGNNGNHGSNGTNGDNGSIGDNGSTGDNGSVGENGSNGDNGSIGENGSNGDNGSIGDNGGNGDDGNIGDNGGNGDDGSIGDNGGNGDDGSIGDNGGNGDNGDDGVNGDNGDNGETGDNGDNGDNGDDGDNPPETKEEKKPEENKLKFKLRPLALFDIDGIMRVINLTPELKDKGYASINTFENGFQVQRYKMILGGLGAQLQFFFENGTGLRELLGGAIGLAPMKSRTAVFNYFVNDQKELNVIERKIPWNAHDINEWRIGDNAYFETTGGMFYIGSIGWSVLASGMTMIDQGAWRVYVEKTDHEKVLVSFSRAELKSRSTFNGVIVGSAVATKYDDKGAGFSYEMDLSDFETARAYEDLLKGNVAQVQKMSIEEFNPFVEEVDSFNYLVKTKSKSFVFGIPFINVANSQGSTYSYQNIDSTKEGFKTVSEYGIYFKSLNGRLITRHTNMAKVFKSGLATTTKEGKLVANDHLSQLEWFYEKDHAKGHDLDKALRILNEDTGIKVNLTAPSSSDLSYLTVKLAVKSDMNFAKAMSSLSKGKSLQVLKVNAKANIAKYFSNGDKDNLCKGVNNVVGCKSHYENETMSALNEIASTGKAYGNVKSKNFTSETAKLGKLIWKNRFVFQAVTEKMALCGSQLDLQVAGEKISNYQTQSLSVYNEEKCN